MKPITLVTPIFPPDIGGPASYVSELEWRLFPDFETTIVGFCSTPAQRKNRWLIDPKRFSFWGRQWNLWRNLREHAVSELLFLHSTLDVGFTTSLFAKKHSKKIVIKFVGDLAWEEASRLGKTSLNLEKWLYSAQKDLRSHLLQKCQKWSLDRANEIVVPSEFLKTIVTKHYGQNPEKVKVIPNASEQRPLTRKQPKKARRLMTAGRLVPHKHFDEIINALARLPSDFTLSIFGDGPLRPQLEKQVLEKNLASQVYFYGKQSPARIYEELQKHDLFILYSSYEGLPHSVLEAFATGCVVIASDIPGTKEVAIHGETAVLVPPHQSETLAMAILELADDQKKRQNLCENALHHLKTHHSWTRHLKELKALLSKQYS